MRMIICPFVSRIARFRPVETIFPGLSMTRRDGNPMAYCAVLCAFHRRSYRRRSGLPSRSRRVPGAKRNRETRECDGFHSDMDPPQKHELLRFAAQTVPSGKADENSKSDLFQGPRIRG